MNKEKIQQFFKPDWTKISILIIFLFIAFGGYTQSWVFGGKDAGLPKPPLFDILSPFPFWSIWVVLLLPLALLSNLLVFIGGYNADIIMRGPFWLFAVINLIYFYLLSCLILFFWRKWKIRKPTRTFTKKKNVSK